MLRTIKLKTTPEDFEDRKNRAIELIKDKEFISHKSLKFKFSEAYLRNEFSFEDIDKIYDKYDNVYFDGNFVMFPLEKLIWV
jgi:uncharacterized membrane protein YcaP (DUF421 family)